MAFPEFDNQLHYNMVLVVAPHPRVGMQLPNGWYWTLNQEVWVSGLAGLLCCIPGQITLL